MGNHLSRPGRKPDPQVASTENNAKIPLKLKISIIGSFGVGMTY
jgi:hypothetical protein